MADEESNKTDAIKFGAIQIERRVAQEKDTVRSKVSPSISCTEEEDNQAASAYCDSRPAHAHPLLPLNSSRRLVKLVVDIFIACLPGYFLVFGALVYFADGKNVPSENNVSLLDAARYGPTIFPILFAAVAAKFLKATAAYLLECGTSVGCLEHLLASRTVASVITSVWKFRQISTVFLFLVLFWALSPLGGQASLRVVSIGSVTTVISRPFKYVDVYSPWPVKNSSALQPYRGLALALITSALVSPELSKAAGQDAYSNLKVPMLESLPRHTNPNADGWYDTIKAKDLAYASITGIPIDGLPAEGTSVFTIDTSYMYANCNQTYLTPSDGLLHIPQLPGNDTEDVVGARYLTIKYNTPPHFFNSTFPRHLTVHRKRGEQWLIVTCDLTTTFVEVKLRCDGSDCNNTAVRSSTKLQAKTTNTVLDLSAYSARNFFDFAQTVIESEAIRGTTLVSGSTPIAQYVVDHDQPYPELFEWLKFNQITDRLYSQRLSQLLNTFWINGVAAHAVIGIFNATSAESPKFSTTTGETTYVDPSIKCNMGWLAVLLLASGTAFLAGLAAAAMSALRKGPDILDIFVASLRDRNFVSLPHGSSVEDGPTQARRLRNTKVGLCDVQPGRTYGYLAVATLDDKVVGHLRGDRLYT